mmetsp:Transcript_29214/g.57205  ORF Transcript_29214/g.57205 Transcript_29214/m.57205 type:complete len:155 (-) Transcript_29214:215-679(-)
MARSDQKLLVGACCVGLADVARRRQQPCCPQAVIFLALSAVAFMKAGFAFSVAAFAAAPRLQPLRPGSSGQLAGGAAVSEIARSQTVMAALSWMPSMPQICDDSFDCNDGKANFPLQCLDLAFIKVCVDPDDFDQSAAVSGEPAYVPIPVRAER